MLLIALLPRMRLINARTYEIREFFANPKYAILSRTWGEEVTLQDMTESNAAQRGTFDDPN